MDLEGELFQLPTRKFQGQHDLTMENHGKPEN
jgi:hypothetical protein